MKQKNFEGFGKTSNSPIAGNTLALISIFLFAAGFPAAEVLLEVWHPITLMFFRLILAVATLVVLWIFMEGLTQVLNAPWFKGLKIGILGLNGSGKSTLLKIIAGVDTNYRGDVVFADGYSVGYLEQEPQLDDSKTIEMAKKSLVNEIIKKDEINKFLDLKDKEFINEKLLNDLINKLNLNKDEFQNLLIQNQSYTLQETKNKLKMKQPLYKINKSKSDYKTPDEPKFKKGGRVGKKFPDLSGDGKVTKKDILMGRGVIKK